MQLLGHKPPQKLTSLSSLSAQASPKNLLWLAVGDVDVDAAEDALVVDALVADALVADDLVADALCRRVSVQLVLQAAAKPTGIVFCNDTGMDMGCLMGNLKRHWTNLANKCIQAICQVVRCTCAASFVNRHSFAWFHVFWMCWQQQKSVLKWVEVRSRALCAKTSKDFQLVQGRKSLLATATKTASLKCGMFGRWAITAKRFGLAARPAMPKATLFGKEVMRRTCFCEAWHLHTGGNWRLLMWLSVFSNFFHGIVIRFCKTWFFIGRKRARFALLNRFEYCTINTRNRR